jgi:hypothetical protein
MWAVMKAMSAPSWLLQKKFQALGTLKGKSKAEIVAAVGPPKGIHGIGDGKVNLLW